jgi:5'-AMP-activated protein kinase catalytic alpha subunit
VYHACCVNTSQSAAIKVIDRDKSFKCGLVDQMSREISVMKLVKHLNIVQLYEVMAAKTKIYFVLEYIKGGELFKKGSTWKAKRRSYWKILSTTN